MRTPHSRACGQGQDRHLASREHARGGAEMSEWKPILDEEIEGRSVTIERHDEGDYRIKTTQGSDDPGSVKRDGSSTIIIPPTERGRPITIEGSKEEIAEQLRHEGFSDATIERLLKEIAGLAGGSAREAPKPR